MATSRAHQWGQVIGQAFEEAVREILLRISQQHHIYLDQSGLRPARSGRKVTWTDRYGNQHDLDYVLERGGTDAQRGTPAAFIEIAWRRYTKHSRNKVQEIESAIGPLAETFGHLRPFLAVIVAGEFTAASLQQLRSKGFYVVHIPYQAVIAAFGVVGIHADFNETTSEAEFKRKLAVWNRLDINHRQQVKQQLIQHHNDLFLGFANQLERSLQRQVLMIRLIAWEGRIQEFTLLSDAIAVLTDEQRQSQGNSTVMCYELEIRFSNGDSIKGEFVDRQLAVEFLKTFQAK